jgi:hypothetical protein
MKKDTQTAVESRCKTKACTVEPCGIDLGRDRNLVKISDCFNIGIGIENSFKILDFLKTVAVWL